MWREDLDRVHRIGFAIEDEVREIEVDALIVETDVLHRAHQRNRRFLPSFIAELLSVAPAVLHHLAHGRDRLLVDRFVGILRNEPGVTLHRGNAACLGKIRALLHSRDPRGARLSRNHADRERPLVKIPNLAPWATDHHGRRLDLKPVQSLQQSRVQTGVETLHIYLTRGQAEIVHLGNRRLGLVPDSDNQTETQGLLRLGEQRRTHAGGDDARGSLEKLAAVECRHDAPCVLQR